MKSSGETYLWLRKHNGRWLPANAVSKPESFFRSIIGRSLKMNEQDNVAVVKAAYAAFQQGSTLQRSRDVCDSQLR